MFFKSRLLQWRLYASPGDEELMQWGYLELLSDMKCDPPCKEKIHQVISICHFYKEHNLAAFLFTFL